MTLIFLVFPQLAAASAGAATRPLAAHPAKIQPRSCSLGSASTRAVLSSITWIFPATLAEVKNTLLVSRKINTSALAKNHYMAAGAVQVASFKKGVGRGKLFTDRLLARFLQVFSLFGQPAVTYLSLSVKQDYCKSLSCK